MDDRKIGIRFEVSDSGEFAFGWRSYADNGAQAKTVTSEVNESGTPKEVKTYLKQRLTVNSLMGILRFGAVTAIYLFLYPFLLRSLGPAKFGLWALLCIPSQYLALGDLGISNALIKLVSESEPGKDRERLIRLTGAASIIFTVLGALLTVLVVCLRGVIVRWLRISPELVSDAAMLLPGMAGVIWISLLGSVYTALLGGIQRTDWVHGIQIGASVINAAGIVLTIKLGGGFGGLLLSNLLAALGTWLAASLVARRSAGLGWLGWPRTNWNSLRSLLGFGGFLYIAALSSLLMEPSVKALLARFGNLELVSYFEVASRIPLQARTLFANVLAPLLPAASLLMVDRRTLQKLFSRTMKVLWLSAVPSFLLLAGLASPIIRVWVGKDLPMVAIAVSLLSLGWLFNVLTIPSYLFVQGLNEPRAAMICAFLQGAVCALGAYLLIPRWGLYGAVASEFAGLLLGAIYIIRRLLALCPMTIEEALGQRLSSAVLVSIAFMGCAFLAGRTIRVTSFIGLAALGATFLLSYVALAFFTERGGVTLLELMKEVLPTRKTLKISS
ncbi:MAG TPA: oligosaccharide flippase family protein [Candidatus Acidoferrum sp.]